jgi:hypothetical protein
MYLLVYLSIVGNSTYTMVKPVTVKLTSIPTAGPAQLPGLHS